MCAFDSYLDEQLLNSLVGFLGLFPAGVLLAVVAWVVSYLVYAVFNKLFRL